MDKPFGMVLQSKVSNEADEEISDEVTNEVIQKRKNMLSINDVD
jgi:hypothetical protein